MTIGQNVKQIVGGVVADVYTDFAPNSASRPYAVIVRFGGYTIKPLGREVPNKQNGFYQVEVWDNTRAAASEKALAIDAAFRTSTLVQATPMAEPVDLSDPPVKAYGCRQEFNVWADR